MQTLSSTHKQKRRKLPISLTPLIDVVFILLVFFMLASSFQKIRSVELIPPQKGKAKASPSTKKPVSILVSGIDQYTIGADTYSLEELATILDSKRDQAILIKTGTNAPLQAVVYVLDLTGTLSLPQVSLLPFEETTK